MLDKLKDSLKKSHDYLEDIVEELDDKLEDIGEEGKELWHKARPKLSAFKSALSKAIQSLHTQTDEARLQVHLATMDAADQWQHLEKVMTQLAKHARSNGQYQLEHANLQAHLAKMDARDFANEKGKTLRQDYHQARDKVEKASHKVAETIERSLKAFGDSYTGPYQ